MKNLMTLASLTLLLTACGGGPGVDTETSDSSGAGSEFQSPEITPELEFTADLKSSADFDFSTSRSIAIDFDVAAATSSPGLLSLCTHYSKTDGSYDVDYNSCTVKTPLNNGIYSGKMDVTNDIDSVIGVVWFKDESIAPIYKEFSLEIGAKLARRGQSSQSIVWR